MPLVEENAGGGDSKVLQQVIAAYQAAAYSGSTSADSDKKRTARASVRTSKVGSGPRTTSKRAVLGSGSVGSKKPRQAALLASSRSLAVYAKQYRKVDPNDRFQQRHYSVTRVRQGFATAESTLLRAVRQGKLSKREAQERLTIVERALSAYGTQYVFGGGHDPNHFGPSRGVPSSDKPAETVARWREAGPSGGLDCSGFVRYAFADRDRSIGAGSLSSQDQYALTRRISRSRLQPGDLVFYNGRTASGQVIPNDHVAIYIGNGKIIDAPQTWVHGDDSGYYGKDHRPDSFDFVRIENLNTPGGFALQINGYGRAHVLSR